MFISLAKTYRYEHIYNEKIKKGYLFIKTFPLHTVQIWNRVRTRIARPDLLVQKLTKAQKNYNLDMDVFWMSYVRSVYVQCLKGTTPYSLFPVNNQKITVPRIQNPAQHLRWSFRENSWRLMICRNQLLSYKNVCQTARKIFATQCFFTYHLKHKTVNKVTSRTLSKPTICTLVEEVSNCYEFFWGF